MWSLERLSPGNVACSGLSLSSSSQYCSYSASSLAALSLAATAAVAASCAETGDGMASTPVSVAAMARLSSSGRAVVMVFHGALANPDSHPLTRPRKGPKVHEPPRGPVHCGSASSREVLPSDRKRHV